LSAADQNTQSIGFIAGDGAIRDQTIRVAIEREPMMRAFPFEREVPDVRTRRPGAA